VRYTAHGQAGSRFCWQVDAAGIIVAQADSHIMVYWPSSGFYQVSADEISNISAIGDETSLAVEVLPVPVANFGDSIHGLQLTLFDSCINAPYRTWFFGDGSRSNAIAPIHNYPDSGIYHVTLVADNHYCSDTMYKALHMYQCPSADFAINDMGSQRIYFIATSQYASAYHWSFGDGTSDTVQYLSHQFPNGGTYTVQLILDNGHGCFDTITKQIKVGGVGIAGLKNQGFSIYPNPAKDQLSIICDHSEEYQYKLINELGEELLSGTFHTNRMNLSVAQLPAGVYCLQLRSSTSMYSQKLLIER
jgi:PKD repeat protein